VTTIEIFDAPQGQTLRQRWGHILTLILAIACVGMGVFLRDNALYATVPYNNPQVGISALYPAGWVLDTAGDYVFRVRDLNPTGYKTSLLVDVVPVNQAATTRNILDSLILNRSQTLSTFSVLSQDSITLGENEIPATRMLYTFVFSEQDPFLETIPTVVEGVDVLTIQGGQAIIVSFLTDARDFNDTYPIFEQFLNDLDF
jgi:hypothetical protein